MVTLPVLKLPARYATMADFASVLQRAALERPVVDQTGIEGRYDFDLEFTPDETLFGGAFGKSAEDSGKPGLLAAITGASLGLKLEGTRGAVSVLVIDHVAKPSDN